MPVGTAFYHFIFGLAMTDGTHQAYWLFLKQKTLKSGAFQGFFNRKKKLIINSRRIINFLICFGRFDFFLQFQCCLFRRVAV